MRAAILALAITACAVPRLAEFEQGATVVDHFIDPAGLHLDAAITMPSGTMPRNGWPLVIPLHILSGTHTEALSRLGFGTQAGWPASPIADKAIILWPDGTDRPGTTTQFWNATPACCDQSGTGVDDVDDVGYITAARAYVVATYTIDPTRIDVVGMSAGGALAAELMCTHSADWSHALVVSAGPPTPCADADGLHTVDILTDHGDADTTWFWNATTPHSNTMTISGMSVAYPAADDASQYGCSSFTDTGVTKDFESVAGNETHVLAGAGCPTGTTVTLDRAYGGTHVPGWVTSKWQPYVINYLGI